MKDFFISYNKADRQWAEWIAWQLQEARRCFERVLGTLKKFLEDDHPIIQMVNENLDEIDAKNQPK
jgi:hypothetical protein